MRLFSAPGSSLDHKRAWLMTTPFDRALDAAAPATAGTPGGTWQARDRGTTWRQRDAGTEWRARG